MTRSEHRLGLTPVFKRYAFHYLKKGLGSHAVEPPYDQFYDEVVVRMLYDWCAPAGADVPPQGGFIVEFRYQGERIRWAEFGCRYTGGGTAVSSVIAAKPSQLPR
jgi:hypothetical protein